MSVSLIYNTTIKTVDENGLESQIGTQQFQIEYDNLDTLQTVIPDETTDLTVYAGSKDYNFIDIESDQEITVSFLLNGVAFFSDKGITKFTSDTYGTNLSIVVSNSSGYDANVKIIVAKKV